eukprot:552153-Ditylum_brightwellii.AAC.1
MVPHFELCLDDVAKHVFLEKARQTQKRYMQRNIHYSRGTADLPAMNGNPTQPLNADELLDILEYGVPVSWRREFT